MANLSLSIYGFIYFYHSISSKRRFKERRTIQLDPKLKRTGYFFHRWQLWCESCGQPECRKLSISAKKNIQNPQIYIFHLYKNWWIIKSSLPRPNSTIAWVSRRIDAVSSANKILIFIWIAFSLFWKTKYLTEISKCFKCYVWREITTNYHFRECFKYFR